MDLDCAFKYGICHDVINKCRKDWSLAHDVKLLKYLENFSQNLISRTGKALKSLEDFENDLNSLSINIQTVSQRFQTLANKQFIEHCVLEDDISAYSKQNRNVTEVPSSTSNLMLNNALLTCLSSFHVKYNNYKDGLSVTKSSNAASNVHSAQLLPPLIGTPDFNEYYAQLLSVKERLKEPMQKPEVTVGDSISDKQSLPESFEESLHSSSNVVLDEDNNSLIDNHVSYNEVDPTYGSVSGDMNNTEHDLSSGVVNSFKHSEQRESENLVIRSNVTIKSNGYDNITAPPKNHSLFDDDDSEIDSDDLFLFAKSKPFLERAFVEEREVPTSEKNTSSSQDDSSSVIASEKEEIHRPTNLNVSNNQSLFNIKAKNDKDNSTSNKIGIKDKTKIVNSAESLEDKYSSIDVPKLSANDTFSSNSLNASVSNNPSSTNENDSKGLSFSSGLMTSNSKDEKFTLFSDQDESDDDLFSSNKLKNTKENFKKILEEKISVFGGNPNFSGKLNKNKYSNVANKSDDSSNRPVDYHNKKASLDSTEESYDGDINTLPSYDTSMLHSLVKNRPKIRNKRRPPSRKHLKGIQSNDSSDSSTVKKEDIYKEVETVEESGSAVSVLSPSTEEEDLFVVPTTSMVHEVSSSNLFLDSSLLSPGSSLDNQNIPNESASDVKAVEKSFTSSSFLTSSVKSHDNNLFMKDPSFFSGEPPSISDLKFDSNEEDSNKKSDSSLRFSWNNRDSLFNDSDEDDDDLFSNSSFNKFEEKKVSSFDAGINKKSDSVPGTQTQSNFGNDFFNNMFSSNSNDEDLFKSKDISASRTKPVKIDQEKTGSGNGLNGSKVVKSNVEFKDPLSCFDEGQTD